MLGREVLLMLVLCELDRCLCTLAIVCHQFIRAQPTLVKDLISRLIEKLSSSLVRKHSKDYLTLYLQNSLETNTLTHI